MFEQYFTDSQHRFMSAVSDTLIACGWDELDAFERCPEILDDWEYAGLNQLDAPEDEDYIGCADYSDPSPNRIEECSGGSYEANLMGSPGTRRGDAIRNFRSFR